MVSHTSAHTVVPRVKLLMLSIRKFYEDLTKWVPFWDSFNSSIHLNPALSTIDKFNYLMSPGGDVILHLSSTTSHVHHSWPWHAVVPNRTQSRDCVTSSNYFSRHGHYLSCVLCLLILSWTCLCTTELFYFQTLLKHTLSLDIITDPYYWAWKTNVHAPYGSLICYLY